MIAFPGTGAHAALTAAKPAWTRHGPDLLAIGLVFLAYTVTLWQAHGAGLGASVIGAAANTIPVVIFGALARDVIVKRLLGRPPLFQAVGHIALCAAFSLLSLWLLVVLLGMADGLSPTDFSVRSFSGAGMVWQGLEDVTTYAVLAALTYARFTRPAPMVPPVIPPVAPVEQPAAHAPPPTSPAPAPEPARIFVRDGEDIRPLDLGGVACIGGADDYVEVTTATAKHLVRMTLAEFERNLDPARFARVHRSWIVNLDCVERMEPAGGGRMLLHLSTGHIVPASRAGTKLLRDRII
ncbi:LytTR family DNA-binding domain-containing protein [Nitrospirillum sp. BR 11163]|uniref:LytR/AlgR family response regulator transcription factor n=1 Tax=Nitrospirillum sp. BR 11163 TaxID=3104323 RepID=UPI002AFF125D|nr:LytTR family DNA-binding domain-containing protein [Nitrospirillum sp. BR 11163]MEA1674187.1 LytTR family DNA-binding domain-containing protein [Nitrospirillum sp. BR 11163]